MLYFLLIWSYLTISSYCVGRLGLNFLGAEYFKRTGDRFIISIWLGIILIATILLAASLIIPLSLPFSAGIILSLSLFSLFFSWFRTELVELCSIILSNWLLKIETLTLILVWLTIHQVTWSESAWYHYSATRWMSEFGAVSGIVLILSNLGIISSWFAFIAPLNNENVGFQAGAVANGFIFCLMLTHLSICLFHTKIKKARLSDWFVIYFSILFLIYLVCSREMQLILVSLSPDLPIILLIGVGAWLILLTTEVAGLSPLKPSFWVLKPQIIPLILATGAVTIKLSALPLLFITSLFYAKSSKWNGRRLAISLFIIMLVLLPLVVVGFNNSGCLFYPSSTFCFDLPWSQPIVEINKFADRTQNLQDWFNPEQKMQNNWFWPWIEWVKSTRLNQVMAILVLISFICAINIVRKSNTNVPSEQKWVSALGLLGILFILYKGPLIRFGLGYLLLLPALWLAIYTEENLIFPYQNFIKKYRHLYKLTPWLLGVVLIFSLKMYNFQAFLWLPPPLANVSLIKKQVNNIDYFIPENGACWASQLPCTKKVTLDNIELRKPALGIKAGFVKTTSKK